VDREEATGYEAKILMATSVAPGPHGGEKGTTRPAPAPIPRPPFYGSKVVTGIPLSEIYEYINETALIRGQWQVKKGKLGADEYRALLDSRVYPELKRLQRQAMDEGLLEPAVVYGYFPCRSEGDDLILFMPVSHDDPSLPWGGSDHGEMKEALRFSFPRQRGDRRICISDYFTPSADGTYDVIGMHLVTVGEKASTYAKKLFDAGAYQEYLYFHGLGVESAEALAEYWHRRIRMELGIGGSDAPEVKKLFSQQYRGSRYSFGYPACPSLEDQEKLFRLLRPERIGVALTEEFQLVPEQSTSAIIVHHPEARYFTL
jgi:5-methyltetrahydrofolate--homocysteine methyltransferase